MGQIRVHSPVKLIAAITIAGLERWPAIQKELEEIFSPLDKCLDWYNFVHTRYYQPEMGGNLKKRMISFTELILPEGLPDIKLCTNQIEEKYAHHGKRTVNIDPGYLCASKLVLATTKDYDHRVYLGRGIFADVHLRFRKKHFQPNEWTYPDYREVFVTRFFEEVRQNYLEQLASLPLG